MKNEKFYKINSKLKAAHNNYFSRLFDGLFGGNCRSISEPNEKKIITTSTLIVDGQPISDSKEKANVLNKYFESVFTKENLSDVPLMNQGNDSINCLPDMPNITFSINGIQHQLSVLDMNKVSGPDNISPFILKHCAKEISPILQVSFTQSLDTDTGVLSSD